MSLRVICLKERNMLLTQMGWEAREEKDTRMASSLMHLQLERYTHVKKTMNRIKQVLR